MTKWTFEDNMFLCRDGVAIADMGGIGEGCGAHIAEVLTSAQAAEIERDALREAVKPFAFLSAQVDLHRFDEETGIEVHLPRTNPRKAIPAARICVGDILRARSTLQPQEPHDAP